MTRVRTLIDFICAVNVIMEAAGAEHHGERGGFLSEPEKMALEDYCFRGGTPDLFVIDVLAARAMARTEIDRILTETLGLVGADS